MTLQTLVKKFAELGENIQINNACLCYSMSRILGLLVKLQHIPSPSYLQCIHSSIKVYE